MLAAPGADDSSVILFTNDYLAWVGPNGTIIWGCPADGAVGNMGEFTGTGAAAFLFLGELCAALIGDIIEQCGFWTSLEIIAAGLGDQGAAIDVIACLATLRL